MWTRLIWACVVIWMLAPPVAHAQATSPALILDETRHALSLAGHLDWLEDQHGKLSLNDVQQSEAWTRLPGKLAVGFTPSTIWLRLTVHQPHDSSKEWILYINGAQVDEAVLYEPSSDLTTAKVQRAGRLIPHEQWPLDSRTPAFRLWLAPGEHQIYLRQKSEHTLSNEILMIGVDGFRGVERNQAMFFAAFFGVCLVSLGIQVLFGGIFQHALGRWYMAYTSVACLVALFSSGYLQTFVITNKPLPVDILSLNISLAVLALVRMWIVWVELDSVLPRFSKWYESGTTAFVLVATAWMLIQSSREGVQLLQGALILHTLVSFLISIHLWLRGSVNAGYYVLIFGIVEAGALIRFARNDSLLPINFFTDYAIFIGIGIHLMAMSAYVITRFRNMRETLAIEQKARAEQREFVGLVSHEFKTPLAIIHTSAQQLAANLDAPKDKIHQRAQNIRFAVQRMDRLLKEYLSVERLDTADQPIRLVATDFFEVVEEAVSDWPLERIRLRVGQLPEPFVCDPDMMRIVLRNLLENADRHSPADAHIDLSVHSESDGSLTIRVKDYGEGITSEEMPKLFDKFFRGRASQGTPGAGLGLYIVKRIVTAHRGQVCVDSTERQGTCFVIDLPVIK